MKSVFVGIKNVLLWSYARGTWQYDALCALIVLTLLFWPKGKTAQTATVQTHAAIVVADGMWQRDIEWQTLREFLQQQNRLELINSPREAVVLFLQTETGTVISLSSVEPFGDAQGRVGYPRVTGRIEINYALAHLKRRQNWQAIYREGFSELSQ